MDNEVAFINRPSDFNIQWWSEEVGKELFQASKCKKSVFQLVFTNEVGWLVARYSNQTAVFEHDAITIRASGTFYTA